MCWSATADLVAGTGIACVGVACVARVRRIGDLPLAALPLLLGIHQLVEARVWQVEGGSGPAVIAWTVIAFPLLALWVPLAVVCAEPRPVRSRLAIPALSGLVTGAVLAYVIATRTVRAEIRGHTVGYVIGLPHGQLLVAGYLLATVGALLLSGDRRVRVLGVLAGAGALVCWALWRLEFVSTWCAFAAVCSVVVFEWVGSRRRSPDSVEFSPSS
ncbi:hypothetical protein LXH13_05165 [Streptomyces spinosirectus]|jgi:hypothetical protein|uniref:DUF6629 family protein n=1 Tax=Streptomyces TaxID=1883 RepID=UPI000D3508AF|nr:MULTISPECIES: DUF6629 family protein [Streptomyces]MBY8338576.1 hypothetical protein [Streptomyces plumbidurans]PTM96898.1 hypothetical protein C7821_104282 [Streptomyces sp. VMFN-G11Ma]UIR16454.1 hypothetical protein LXH13_05165 [Streptomyces spinosirectus]